ncbi:unnamed protein product [Adineta steineri]|uniref:Nuclear receptor n=3 Tax=Adineta steineri TaxID=433720 RepID=A0A815KK12_9BILA|nr:unnamed protein product [Adineta steineri]CAF1431722.1 unnamed protein product [Adineta steineri]CAF3698685.1 unnamed protein product [Adineta steineri]
MAYTEQTSTHAIYLQDFRSEPCQVCGENASGWHCGSITCEACKKFFLRSVNGEYLKYRCTRDKTCIITRTTRTQCQFCRYTKCITIGMKITEESSNPKIEEIFKGIPCIVCEGASSGIHFGATTCESCKGFFRRMIRERIPQHYKCLENNNCEINTQTRNMCRACRFRKCLMAGMSIEGSRIGRQSNLFKHKMVEMQRQGLIQSQLFHVFTSNLNNSRKKTTVIRAASSSNATQLRFEDKLDPEIFQQISDIENAYINHLKNLPICSMETNDLWTICISQLDEYSNSIKNFIYGISNLNSINFDDKTSLIHLSIHSVILMCFCIQSSRLQTTNSTWNYFNILSNSSFSQYLQERFPFFFELNQLTYALEKQLQLLELDDKEIALVLLLLITSVENNKSKEIEDIEEEYFSALYDYMTAKRGSDNKDYFILTIQIPFIHRINKLISTNINNLKYSLSYSM